MGICSQGACASRGSAAGCPRASQAGYAEVTNGGESGRGPGKQETGAGHLSGGGGGEERDSPIERALVAEPVGAAQRLLVFLSWHRQDQVQEKVNHWDVGMNVPAGGWKEGGLDTLRFKTFFVCLFFVFRFYPLSCMQSQILPGRKDIGRWENLQREVKYGREGGGLLLTIIISKIIVLIADIH